MSEHVCAACKGLGYLALPDVDYTRRNTIADLLVHCPYCSSGEQRVAMARRSGLEEGEQQVTLDHWCMPELEEGMQAQRRHARMLIQLAIQYKAGLYTFWGDFGAGKSLALQIIVNELRAVGVVGCFAPLAVILEHLRSLYEHREGTSTYWQRLLDIPVLAIDEVTRFYATGWAEEKLFALVDTRYRRRKTHLTLFATNDDPNRSLPPGESLGYLYSRLREGMLAELRGDVRKAVGASLGLTTGVRAASPHPGSPP